MLRSFRSELVMVAIACLAALLDLTLIEHPVLFAVLRGSDQEWVPGVVFEGVLGT